MRREFVNDPRKNLRQVLSDLLFGETGSLGERLYDVRAKGRTKLPRRDRLILAGTNPGLRHIARPPFCSLSSSPPNPPSRPPAPSSGVGWGALVAELSLPPPPKRAPDARRARTASINGFAMPPGTADRIASSGFAIAFLLLITIAISVQNRAWRRPTIAL